MADITDIRIHEVWLLLDEVCPMVRRAMNGDRPDASGLLRGRLVAKAPGKVVNDFGRGSQVTNREWHLFQTRHNADADMIRRRDLP